MIDISQLDQNLAVSSKLSSEVTEQLEFYSIDQPPFSIYGVFREGDHYVRMPEAVAQTVSQRVFELSRYTAGGRIRFVTDSKQIAIHAECFDRKPMSHMAFTGTTGFDLYADVDGNCQYFGTFKPPIDCNGIFEDIVDLPLEGKHTITINMPLYNGVNNLYIGIQKGAVLESAEPLIQPPVVYYGSSITQGGCASRPGCCYEAMLHRHFQTDYINLGFSGNAKAETEIMEYIAGLDMSVFVYDYDHNAPDREHLRATHQRGFQIVREKHPDLPIIIMTRPKYYLSQVLVERNHIIRQTFENAKASGDKNVYFIDGRELLLPTALEYSLVDNTHPTDMGFFGMYTRMLPLMRTLIK